MNYFDRVYEAVKTIPRGKVATYGDVAKMTGNPRASRAVGWALHVNPYQGVVPCHRVVNAKGEVSKAFAFGGGNVQVTLLAEEGVEFGVDGRVLMEKFRFII